MTAATVEMISKL